jgi:selenocysteine lyase/cysteine desulfurase
VDFLAGLAPGTAGATRRERLQGALAGLDGRSMALARQLWEGLRAIPGVRTYGPPPGRPRTPTVSFAMRGRTSDEVARALAPRGLFVSSGDFYATTVVERLGHAADGLVRVGCACYTTGEEIERLLLGVRELGEA